MVTPFTFILLVYLAKLMIHDAYSYSTYIKFVITMLLIELLLLRGYFIRFGTSEVTYQLFTNCALLVYSIVFMVKNHVKVTYKDLFYGGLFLLAAIIGDVYQEIVPYDGLVMTYDSVGSWDAYTLGANNKGVVAISWPRVLSIYITFVTVVVTVFIFHSIVKKETILFIIKRLNKFLKWNIYFIIMEFIIKNIIHSDITLRASGLIFGEGANTYTNLVIRNGWYQLQGLTREPSHLALTLFLTIILYVVEKMLNNTTLTKKQYMYIFFIMMLMIISGAFTSYLYIAIIFIWLVYSLLKKSQSMFRYIMGFFAIVVIIFLGYLIVSGGLDSSTYIGKRITLANEMATAILANSWYGLGGDSALPRFLSIYDTFSDFLERPLFGMGVSVQISHGGLVNMLSDVGLVGLFLWIRLVFNKFSYKYCPIIILLVGSNILVGSELLGTLYIIFIIACFRKDNYVNFDVGKI